MAKYCKYFYLNSAIYPGDRRQGCCGICNRYDSTNSKCECAEDVTKWSEGVIYEEDKE